jgi:hypothetical protein
MTEKNNKNTNIQDKIKISDENINYYKNIYNNSSKNTIKESYLEEIKKISQKDIDNSNDSNELNFYLELIKNSDNLSEIKFYLEFIKNTIKLNK